MCVCVCGHMHVCVCMHVCAHVCTCIYICACVCVFMFGTPALPRNVCQWSVAKPWVNRLWPFHGVKVKQSRVYKMVFSIPISVLVSGIWTSAVLHSFPSLSISPSLPPSRPHRETAILSSHDWLEKECMTSPTTSGVGVGVFSWRPVKHAVVSGRS